VTERFVLGTPLGRWQTNCGIIGDRARGSAVVVDPGEGGAEAIPTRLASAGVACEAILLTHGHLDHVWAVPELARDLDVPVLLHRDDRYLWDDPGKAFGELPPGALKAQFGFDWDPPTEHLEEVADRTRLAFAGLPLEVRHTPGHTPGSSVFLLTDAGQDEPVLLSGDLIFAGSVGRTDFPRGSWDDLLASIDRVVLPLEDRTLILAGHGPETTVGAERAANPFLRELV
jgi:hydroxyacylglutathione hydrolase